MIIPAGRGAGVHKTANVLNNLPKSLQSKAKAQLHQIWQAADKDEANRYFDDFVNTYEAKYPKATQCLEKGRDSLLTFYVFLLNTGGIFGRRIRLNRPLRLFVCEQIK